MATPSKSGKTYSSRLWPSRVHSRTTPSSICPYPSMLVRVRSDIRNKLLGSKRQEALSVEWGVAQL